MESISDVDVGFNSGNHFHSLATINVMHFFGVGDSYQKQMEMCFEGWHYAYKQQGHSLQQGVLLYHFSVVCSVMKFKVLLSGLHLLCRQQENSTFDLLDITLFLHHVAAALVEQHQKSFRCFVIFFDYYWMKARGKGTRCLFFFNTFLRLVALLPYVHKGKSFFGLKFKMDGYFVELLKFTVYGIYNSIFVDILINLQWACLLNDTVF